MKIKAPAKINIFLNVGEEREDKFHELRTIMVKVGLCDSITLKKNKNIKIEGMDWLKDKKNLAYRAAVELQNYSGIKKGCLIEIEKLIPSGAGLGGGSSDAAAVLKGLNKLWDLNYKDEDLENIGQKLGSDVNFFLYTGGGLAMGRGEKIIPLKTKRELAQKVLLIYPDIELSTQKIYNAYPGGDLTGKEELNTIIKNYRSGNWPDILSNDLEETVFREYPVLKDIKHRLINWGLKPLLSGSGSSIFALFSDIEKAESVKSIMDEDFGYSTWILKVL